MQRAEKEKVPCWKSAKKSRKSLRHQGGLGDCSQGAASFAKVSSDAETLSA